MSIKFYYKIAKDELFPICRSITGKGIQKSLKIIKREFPDLKIYTKSSGSKVFDWKIPPEWNVSEAYVLDVNNKKIIDFKENNLHLVGYSIPVQKFLNKKNLFKKIHTLIKQPNAIPFITSYYKRYWGFCISENYKIELDRKYKDNDKFKIVIKSNLNYNGKLVYGELKIPGKSKKEILVSTNICHPSMANNELSGPIVSMSLIKYFQNLKKNNYTLRFIFIPETIGSITFLHKNLNYLKKYLIGGYNLTCIGDERNHSCILSKYENSLSDKALFMAYKKLKIKFNKYSLLLEKKSDERQFNSPGIEFPIATISRSRLGEYKEYHTSLDNFNVVTLKGLSGGFFVAKKAIEILMKKIVPKNNFLCEPQMGKRNLYPSLSTKYYNQNKKNFMNFLQYSDGKNELSEISKIIKVDNSDAKSIYNILIKKKLVF